MIYGILFVSEVLTKVKLGMGRRDAEKVRWSPGTETWISGLTNYRLSIISRSTRTSPYPEMQDSR